MRTASPTAAAFVEREVGPCAGLACVAAHLENPHRPQDQDPDEWEAILRVNLTGTFRTLIAFGAPMVERGKGSIVTIGSITAYNSSPLMAYGPTKAAIVNMARNFAVSWGRSGVRVNTVSPGPTRTPGGRGELCARRAQSGDDDPPDRARTAGEADGSGERRRLPSVR